VKRYILVSVALAVIVLAGAAWVVQARRAPEASTLAPVLPHTDGPRAPAGVRIRVQVLNTTGVHGLARRATRLLRDRGFDVVEMGNASPALDTTVVIDRSGNPGWTATVAKVLRPAMSRTERDSSRYLDITVLLGRAWRPPAEALDP
jgi:hypothetical protein